jgi:hypothetical protein
MTKGELSLMKKIMDSGTHADKISALSINVRDNPKLSLGSLAQLLMMVRAGHLCLSLGKRSQP